tara:strand:- start:433 stop:627 length:195 start_codon:yes stop_codon:yes gene_type:complete
MYCPAQNEDIKKIINERIEFFAVLGDLQNSHNPTIEALLHGSAIRPTEYVPFRPERLSDLGSSD